MLHSRIKRVEEEYRHQLAQIIAYEIADPRVGLATVTRVRVSKDLSEAVVLVSFLEDDPAQADEALSVLQAARGYIKCLLAERLSLKRLPDPHFRLDNSAKKAFQVYDILSEIKREEPPADSSSLPDATPGVES
ncbi:MAG TPA: 30S ribosome-binding factor RbfA [Sumerlaeia bacterium]|nr:30S ribosome-binding factor RbfA [Sumerlaeia bacterium]